MSSSLAMLGAVIRKEIRQTVRDRRMMALLLVAPLVQLFIFGHAVNLDVDRVPTVVVDLDDSHASRTHLSRLLADGTLRKVAETPDMHVAEAMMETGGAATIMVVPKHFEREQARGESTQVQMVIDGSDPNRSGVAFAAVSGYFAGESRARAAERLGRLAAFSQAPPAAGEIDVRTRVFFNPALDTAIYMVPGVATILLMLITTIVTAMGLSRERERGTLEQILVTPVPGSVLLLGKILPFAAFGLFDFGLAVAVGAYVFDMPIRGEMSLLFFATSLYLLTTLGIGLLISSISKSQQQAFMGGFLFMLPAALLSGIMTPVRSMPPWLQPFTILNPLRHYAEVLRGALLRGAGLFDLAPQLLVLAVMGGLIFSFAAYRFRKSLG